jgi:hypothetical protein
MRRAVHLLLFFYLGLLDHWLGIYPHLQAVLFRGFEECGALKIGGFYLVCWITEFGDADKGRTGIGLIQTDKLDKVMFYNYII